MPKSILTSLKLFTMKLFVRFWVIGYTCKKIVKESFYEEKKIQMVAAPIGGGHLSDGGELGLWRIENKCSCHLNYEIYKGHGEPSSAIDLFGES